MSASTSKFPCDDVGLIDALTKVEEARSEKHEFKVTWAAAYLRDDRGRVLVQMREEGLDAGKYGPPGGKCETGETISQCLMRELREETGIVATCISLQEIYETARGTCFFFRVHEWIGEPRNREAVHGSWQWVSMDDLVSSGKVQGGLARHLGMSAPGCEPMGVRRG